MADGLTGEPEAQVMGMMGMRGAKNVVGLDRSELWFSNRWR